MAYIRFENICKNFGDNHVLKNVNLEIEQGDLVTLLGPSGCGKSTLLRCLAGLEKVTSGRIYLDGVDITDKDPKDRDIGMVFQQYSLFPNLSIEQNVAFGLKMKKVPKDEIDKRVKEILEIVGLSDKAKQYPNQLSGGQQQRAALARAIVTKPKVLLLDEPLSAIDALLRKNLQIEIRKLQKDFNITAIFVTHDQDEAMVMSDVIHLMYGGLISQSDSPTMMYTRPTSKFAASFIGHYNIVSAEDFIKITNREVPCKDIAIRPEVIELSRKPIEKHNSHFFKGIIQDSIPRGNIYRYTVLVEDVTLTVDVLFRASMMFEKGEELYMAVRCENCIEL